MGVFLKKIQVKVPNNAKKILVMSGAMTSIQLVSSVIRLVADSAYISVKQSMRLYLNRCVQYSYLY